MRGTLKTSTLESKFPLLRVENNCIISKFADITAAYRVSLPELFTLTGEDMARIEALDGGESLFFSHYDPKTVEWFMSIL